MVVLVLVALLPPSLGTLVLKQVTVVGACCQSWMGMLARLLRESNSLDAVRLGPVGS